MGMSGPGGGPRTVGSPQGGAPMMRMGGMGGAGGGGGPAPLPVSRPGAAGPEYAARQAELARTEAPQMEARQAREQDIYAGLLKQLQAPQGPPGPQTAVPSNNPFEQQRQQLALRMPTWMGRP